MSDIKSGREIRCFTFNKNNGVITNPANALAAYTAFLRKVKPHESLEGFPWDYLISKNLVKKYENTMS
jgi:hypothetical protein